MKSWHIYVSILAVFLFGFLFYSDSLAKYAWEEGRMANLALVLNRSDAKLAMDLGNYYFNGGAYDLKKAEHSYIKAIEYDPKILRANYELARIYFVKGEDRKAIEHINKEIEINPQNLRSLYVRGLIYGSIGRLSEAEEDFRKFVSWSPSEWAGYNDLAWVLAKARKYKEAEEVLEKALQSVSGAGENPWLWNSLGVTELNQKKPDEAQKSFKRALEALEKLTLKEWQRAYPGNDPAESEKAFSDFKRAIEANLSAAEADSVDN